MKFSGAVSSLIWKLSDLTGVSLTLVFAVSFFVFANSTIVPYGQADTKHCELTIYTYDSIVARGGLGPAIFPGFEKQTGCKIKVLASGDGVQALSRLELDAKRGKPSGQILLGIDQSLWKRARPYVESWERWRPEAAKKMSGHSAGLSSGGDDSARSAFADALKNGFMPYDYGVLALMMDREAKLKPPHSLRDLTKPEWKKKFILEDPRTSTPGLQYLLLTREVLKEDDFKHYWSELKSQWRAMPQGWDAAYGLFLKGEAPLAWSYLTSQAYHEEKGSHRYQAVLFEEGQPLQIETAAMVKGSFSSPEQKLLAKRFLEYLISDEVQNAIPKANWMFPVIQGAKLPKSFRSLPRPKAIVQSDWAHSGATLELWRKAIWQ
jgi:thiamine transport system substrate-binding protein